MTKHKRFCAQGAVSVEVGVHDRHYKRTHYRPQYTREQAVQVEDWLNGVEQPLPFITAPSNDLRSPYRIQAMREGRLYRIGLEPLR